MWLVLGMKKYSSYVNRSGTYDQKKNFLYARRRFINRIMRVQHANMANQLSRFTISFELIAFQSASEKLT
jgi:hypothetical protein